MMRKHFYESPENGTLTRNMENIVREIKNTLGTMKMLNNTVSMIWLRSSEFVLNGSMSPNGVEAK